MRGPVLAQGGPGFSGEQGLGPGANAWWPRSSIGGPWSTVTLAKAEGHLSSSVHPSIRPLTHSATPAPAPCWSLQAPEPGSSQVTSLSPSVPGACHVRTPGSSPMFELRDGELGPGPHVLSAPQPQPAEQARKLLKLALWVGGGRWGNQGRSELRTELHLLWAPILRAFAQGTPEGQGRLQVWSQ